MMRCKKERKVKKNKRKKKNDLGNVKVDWSNLFS